MLLGAEANAAEALEQQMLSRLDEQTLVGGKHVARQQLPDLPEHAETTVHRVKISLLDLADLLAGHPAWAWAMRGVESLGEPAVPVRFGAPAASVGVDGQGPGVDALGGEDGQVAGAGAEAGTMLADVGIRAGALCLGAQVGGVLRHSGHGAALAPRTGGQEVDVSAQATGSALDAGRGPPADPGVGRSEPHLGTPQDPG
jgi:hypothetical protein